jgi:hypothetical protein
VWLCLKMIIEHIVTKDARVFLSFLELKSIYSACILTILVAAAATR